MPANADLPIPNHFLASLSPDDYEFLRPHLEPLDLPLRMILHETGQPIDYCYFTDGGMTSLLIQLEDGALIEAGLVGKEGFAGLSALTQVATGLMIASRPGPKKNGIAWRSVLLSLITRCGVGV